eukprot:COSAG05_NODE_6695_length_919_cov_1.126829_1_plen_63_part_01
MARDARSTLPETAAEEGLFAPPHVVGCKGSDPSLVEVVRYPKEVVKDELAEIPWHKNIEVRFG